MARGSRAVTYHEIRDPIHAFVRLDSTELKAINSKPFQRLRYIHQLALTSLVYPAATHKRFEHCLGVMELASRVYDVITNPVNVIPKMNYLVPRVGEHDFTYWRRVVRMAALCHDLGHLPFSHAAEGLLPDGRKHEYMTRRLIESTMMEEVWSSLKLRANDVAKIAVGAKHHEEPLDEWESILSEIIIGDSFGVDRMDYLLRDSHHVGVAYGRFDHFRLIDTIRILPKGDVGSPKPDPDLQLTLPLDLGKETEGQADADNSIFDSEREQEPSEEPTLGIEDGGLQSAEGLLWARQFMWSQVYMHPTRQIYDLHLEDFLRAWLPGGKFNTDVEAYLSLTDNEVFSALAAASRDHAAAGHEPALCIMERQHFRRVYKASPSDKKIALDATELIYEALADKFGAEHVKIKALAPKSEGKHFPVLLSSGICEDSTALSDTFNRTPVVSSGNVYVHPRLRDDAKSWLDRQTESILRKTEGEEEAKDA